MDNMNAGKLMDMVGLDNTVRDRKILITKPNGDHRFVSDISLPDSRVTLARFTTATFTAAAVEAVRFMLTSQGFKVTTVFVENR